MRIVDDGTSEYQVGDLVMLSTDKLAVGRGKLKDRWVGPFPVKEAYSNGVNVRLELPDEYSRLHPVFHVERLKRYVPSAVDWPNRQQPDRPRAKLSDRKEAVLGGTHHRQEGGGGDSSPSGSTSEGHSTESSPQQDASPTESAGRGEMHEEKEAPSARRISPRDHASSRATTVPPPRVKKAKTASDQSQAARGVLQSGVGGLRPKKRARGTL